MIWAFYQGTRGLTGYSSFAQFLSVHRGVPNKKALPMISGTQILSEADRFHRLTGRWPNARSGPLHNGNGDSWMKVDNALRFGLRGLPKGSSLFRFLKKHRRISNSKGGNGGRVMGTFLDKIIPPKSHASKLRSSGTVLRSTNLFRTVPLTSTSFPTS